MARKKAHKMAKNIDGKYPNARTNVSEIGEQPFASFNYRKLEDISEPINEDKLPF